MRRGKGGCYWRTQRDSSAQNRIINFASASGLQGSPGQPNYAAAKMGIIGLTYSLAQGLQRYGVTANAVSPAAATRLTGTIEGSDSADSFQADPRYAPDNVAPIVAYLASEGSHWLSGRVLSAGGYKVGLYNNPQEIASVSSDGPWDLRSLERQVEGGFRPLADGLPPSIFATPSGEQLPR